MRAVLVGAGHAHLHVISRADEFRRRGHELVVVAPGAFWYSGLATGMLGGLYPPELDRIDVAALAAQGRARFIRDRIVGLDRAAGEVILEGAGRLGFDALSLNLGSAPWELPGSDLPGVFAVKPVHRLRDLRHELEQRFSAGGGPVGVVIAGAGPTGAELAGNIARLADTHHASARITILAGSNQVLQRLPPRAAALVRANLERRGVRFLSGRHVVRLEAGEAVVSDKERVAFDIFINATGLHPPQIMASFGLPLSAGGALVVDDGLRSPADPRIHGGGDCVAVQGHALERIGVYAIRQAPVLLHNLLARLDGTAPRPFQPQTRYLWIMNLGDGTGVAMRGDLWWHGRLAFHLKDWIDREFLASYRPG